MPLICVWRLCKGANCQQQYHDGSKNTEGHNYTEGSGYVQRLIAAQTDLVAQKYLHLDKLGTIYAFLQVIDTF